MTIKDWNIEAMTGYKPMTTFYVDFSIADHFGLDAVQDTFNRAFKEWKCDCKYLTELVMALNWKIFEHYQHNEKLAVVYDELWQKAAQYAETHLKGEELSYYYRTTD